MMHWTDRNRGFTIVELLIVIVVIGILAAIVIVAYNGIQTRSKNTQLYTGVGQYSRALALYIADNNNVFPIDTSGSGSVSCLDGGSACNGAYDSAKTAQLKTAILTKMNSLPKYPNTSPLINYSTQVKDSGGNYTGWYILLQQYGQGTCGSMGGLTYLNSSVVGSDKQCRYSIDAAN